MHIEPGVVDGAKMALSYVTVAGAAGLGAAMARKTIVEDSGVAAFIARSLIATLLVFFSFEVLPTYPVGVSEVHFILGATLFLILGAGPAAIGLAAGLAIQGLLFAPADLPQYAMNVTTLIVPLYGVSLLAKRLIAPQTAYVDLSYGQVLALSTAYQGGVIGWVAFWAFYGQGFGAENLANVASFGLAYLTVIVIEPLIDLAVLAGAKTGRGATTGALFTRRLHRAA